MARVHAAHKREGARMSLMRRDRSLPVLHDPSTAFTVVGGDADRVIAAIMCETNDLKGSLFFVRVLNSGPQPIFCTVFGEGAKGLEALAPFEFRVAASGTEDAYVFVPRRWMRPLQRIVISLRGASLQYRMDAAVPRIAIPLWARAGAVAAIAVLALIFGRAGAVELDSSPMTAVTHHVVRIPYQIYGIGSATYRVTRDGAEIASGALPAGRGELAFDSGDRSGTLYAAVTLSQFGVTRTSTSAPIVVATPLPPPQITLFHVSTQQAHPGQRVDVSYALDAEDGSIGLMDARDDAVERVPIHGAGRTSFTAPATDRAQRYRVVVIAQRGGAMTQLQTDLLVAPSAAPSATASPSSSPSSVTLSSTPNATFANALTASELIRVETNYAVGGRALPVQILKTSLPMSIALQDDQGQTLEKIDVAPGTPSVDVPLPRVDALTMQLLVVTVQNGSAQQSVLVPLAVHPH